MSTRRPALAPAYAESKGAASSWLTVTLLITVASVADIAASDSSGILFVGLLVSVAIGSLALAIRALSPVQLAIIFAPVAFYAPVGPRLNLSLADIVIALMALHLVVRGQQQHLPKRAVIGVRALAIFAWALQLVLWLSLLLAALDGPISSAGLIAPLKLVVLVVFTMMVFVEGGRSRNDLVKLLITWRQTGTVVAGLAIGGYVFHAAGLPNGLTYGFRATGTLEDPNSLATYTLVSLGISMAATYASNARAYSWHLAPMVAACLLSGSRAGLVALIAAGIIAAIFAGVGRSARRFRIGLLGVAASGTATFWIMPEQVLRPVINRLTLFAETGLDDDPIRESLWRAALELWLQNPFFGVGIGQFPTASRSMHVGSPDLLTHNTYLSFLAETGIVGLSVFFTLPVLAVASLFIVRLHTLALVPFFMYSLLAFAAMAFTLNLENFRPYWILLGLIFAYAAIVRHEGSTISGSHHRPPGTTLPHSDEHSYPPRT